MELDSNNHSVFLLYYHLVLVVKYRRKVFSEQMSQYAKDIFVRISSSYNITLEEWNHDQDHIHIMFRAHPILAKEKVFLFAANRTLYIQST